MTALFLTLLALATSRVAAEEMYNGDEYLAPAVASAAAAMAASFAQYVHYSPTPAPTVAQGPAVNVLAKTKKSATPSATACSYWLDNIKHQGVAAFNDNTSKSWTVVVYHVVLFSPTDLLNRLHRLQKRQKLWRKR